MSTDGVKMESLKDKFFKRVIIKDGCWGWKNKLLNTGYGTMHVNGKNMTGHRISLMVHGIEIPPKMCVDHICRNRACTNPEHLRIVTRGQNVLENSDGLAAKNKAKTHCLNGHKFDETNLYLNKGSDGTLRRHCRRCRYEHKRDRRKRLKALGVNWRVIDLKQ